MFLHEVQSFLQYFELYCVKSFRECSAHKVLLVTCLYPKDKLMSERFNDDILVTVLIHQCMEGLQ